MENEKLIKDAQYRKGLSIAFFNANNVAAQLVEIESKITPELIEAEATKVLKKNLKSGKVQKLATKMKPLSLTSRIVFYRDWLLEEHAKYYAEVIANVGTNYKSEDSIAKLKKSKTLEDLETAWRLLSADERKDGEIRKIAQELKKQYVKSNS